MHRSSVASRRKRRPAGDIVFQIANHLAFSLFTVLCVYPFYYLIINTISANDLSGNGAIMFWPSGIHFTNYAQVIRLPGLLNAAFISVSRTVAGTVLPVMASAFLGFMFTKTRMWGRKFWYRFILVTMYFSAGLIPYYITMLNLGLINNFLAYIVPAIVQPFNIILVKTYVESTPASLQESAEIDGAGTLTVFLRIILPITTPILATVAIFCAVGQWNSFTDTVILMTDSKLDTLQFILYKYINQANSLAALIRSGGLTFDARMANAATTQTATSVRMTVSVIVILPILMIYPYFQRYFVKGLLIGAIKG
jgi:ABC-type glycerol-3-phosphate transport system permease component